MIDSNELAEGFKYMWLYFGMLILAVVAGAMFVMWLGHQVFRLVREGRVRIRETTGESDPSEPPPLIR